MADNDEISCAPLMRIVPGLVTVPEAALDTCGDAQGLVVGWDDLSNGHRAIFVGVRQKDGTAMIAAIPMPRWPALAKALGDVLHEASQTAAVAQVRQ